MLRDTEVFKRDYCFSFLFSFALLLFLWQWALTLMKLVNKEVGCYKASHGSTLGPSHVLPNAHVLGPFLCLCQQLNHHKAFTRNLTDPGARLLDFQNGEWNKLSKIDLLKLLWSAASQNVWMESPEGCTMVSNLSKHAKLWNLCLFSQSQVCLASLYLHWLTYRYNLAFGVHISFPPIGPNHLALSSSGFRLPYQPQRQVYYTHERTYVVDMMCIARGGV